MSLVRCSRQDMLEFQIKSRNFCQGKLLGKNQASRRASDDDCLKIRGHCLDLMAITCDGRCILYNSNVCTIGIEIISFCCSWT